MSQGSRDVAGGIWRFLIGLIVTPIIVLAVLVGWCTGDADRHQPQQPTPPPVAAVPAAPTLPLPSVDVDATKIIGKSRQAIRKYLGKPGENNREIEFFDVGEGITVEVQYYKGRGGQMAVTSTTAGMFHDSTRVQEWAHLPPLTLTATRDFAGVKDSRNTVQSVDINGKRCGVGLTDHDLTVLTEEYEQSP
jgi:hypothetical protein